MGCEYCDRNNVLKAYCYFLRHPGCFLYTWKKELSLETFAEYAVSAQLSWKTRVSCQHNAQVAEKWKEMLPVLTKALREAKLSEPTEK